MIWLNKVKRWIIAHKNWLVLMGLFIVSYLLGKKTNKNYYEMAKLAKDQYKKENEEILRQQKLKEKRDNTTKLKADKVKKALEAEKETRLKELENKKIDIDHTLQSIGIKNNENNK